MVKGKTEGQQQQETSLWTDTAHALFLQNLIISECMCTSNVAGSSSKRLKFRSLRNLAVNDY